METPTTKDFWKDYWVITVKRRPWLKWAMLGILLLIAGGYCTLYYYTGNIPFVGDLNDDSGKPLDFGKLGRSEYKKSSYVYAKDGYTVIGRFFDQDRDQIKINEIPELLKDGFMAAEDKRFNANRPKRLFIDYFCDPLYIGGIDTCAIIRSGIHIIRRVPTLSGASGIRAQLVRLLYADEVTAFRTRERTLKRKIKEARAAIQLSRRYSKDKLLEGFLNQPYLGYGVNGVAEASERYFGKNIRKDKLTLREIAILVSLNKSPTKYSPIFHESVEPKISKLASLAAAQKQKEEYEKKSRKEIVRFALAIDRYNWVLGRLNEDGYISEKEYNESLFNKDEAMDRLARLRPLKNKTFGYASRFVKEILLTTGYGDKEITDYGGLRITTTIDPQIQRIATEEFEKHMAELNQEEDPGDKLEGSFIIMKVKTGQILAMAGGINFNESQYNRVLARRSPGSLFKPFVYGAAMEYFHYGFYDKICNCPFSMRGANGKRWAPKNFKEDNPVPLGYVNFSTGLIRSVNLLTLNLARKIGIDSVIAFAHGLGIWGKPESVLYPDEKIWFKKPGIKFTSAEGLDPRLPTAIGASDVNLLELANAYAVFFRNGVYLKPTLIEEVKDSEGNVLFKAPAPEGKRVISEDTARKLVVMMRAVSKVGTAKISMKGIGQQVAVKTGTSNGPTDLGMGGGTPDLVMIIRIGHDQPKPIVLPQYMKRMSGRANMQVSGGWVVGPLFRKIIDRIYQTRPKVEFAPEIEQELQDLLANYHDR